MDEFLREAIHARGWSVPRLADECAVATGLAQKWVSKNPQYRANPGPASCEKIAQALGEDLDYILELAGHRPAHVAARTELSARQRAVLDQADRWIAAVGPEQEEYFWRYLKAQGDSIVALIRDIGTAVNTGTPVAVSAAVNRQPKRSQPEQLGASRTLRSRLPTPQTLLRRALFAAPAVAAL